MKTIGFVGAYAYDIILYLGRMLCQQGKRILVIDRTTEQEIIRTLHPAGREELFDGIFCFCGIDITARVILPGGADRTELYDIVLYDFGGNTCPDDFALCEIICYVLDMYEYNALRVKNFVCMREELEEWMILRDLYRGRAMSKYHMHISGKSVARKNLFSIRLNSNDFVARFRMEADQQPRVELAGEDMKEVVYQLAVRLCPEITQSRQRRGIQRKERYSA